MFAVPDVLETQDSDLKAEKSLPKKLYDKLKQKGPSALLKKSGKKLGRFFAEFYTRALGFFFKGDRHLVSQLESKVGELCTDGENFTRD